MKNALRVNAMAKVDNERIQRITHNGREHLVIPSFTLPDNVVMNGGLYPADEIAKSFKTLEGTLAPVGHPTVNGKAVVATRAEAINAHYHGVWNHKVTRDEGSKRVYIEKWVDVEFAERSEMGRALLDAINSGQPLHTSTGLHCEREMVTNGAAGYSWVARNMRFDHDAILFDEPGAATPEDGVGMMVNSAELVVNAVLPALQTNKALENSYSQKRDLLNAAVREVFGSTDSHPYVEDFNDSALIFWQSGSYKMVSYEMDGAALVLSDTVTDMVARTDFVAKGSTVVTTLSLQGNSVQSEPVKLIDNSEKPQDMNADELKAALALALAPVNDQLTALKEENKALRESMETNSKKADAEHRAAIKAVRPELELVANSLTGEPLEALAASLQTAASIKPGAFQHNSKSSGFKEYEGV